MVKGFYYFFLLILITHSARSMCSNGLCASVVTKCMLTQSCDCDMSDVTNCTCCKTCHVCLGQLYTDCCACVGLCPVYELNAESFLFASTVEPLNKHNTELFHILIEDDLNHSKPWTSHSIHYKESGGEKKIQTSSSTTDAEDDAVMMSSSNCTVLYLSDCMSLNRCRTRCGATGAAHYRWFHQNGCCECIPATCRSLGRGKPMCNSCPSVVIKSATDFVHKAQADEDSGLKRDHDNDDDDDIVQDDEVDIRNDDADTDSEPHHHYTNHQHKHRHSHKVKNNQQDTGRLLKPNN